MNTTIGFLVFDANTIFAIICSFSVMFSIVLEKTISCVFSHSFITSFFQYYFICPKSTSENRVVDG